MKKKRRRADTVETVKESDSSVSSFSIPSIPDPTAKRHRTPSRDLVKYTPDQVNQIFDRFLDKVNQYPLSTDCSADQRLSPVWLTWLIEYEGLNEHICLPETLQLPQPERIERMKNRGWTGAHIAQWTSARYLAHVILTYDNIGNEQVKITGIKTLNVAEALHSCTQPVAVLLLDLDEDPAYSSDPEEHRNGLIFNFHERTYERFEPNGWYWSGVDDYLNGEDFRQKAGLSNSWVYIAPYQVCPVLGPQDVAGLPSHCQDDGGYCVLFTMIYIHLRMLMPLNEPEEIITLLIELESTQLRQLAQKYNTWMNTEVQDGIWLGDNENGKLEREKDRGKQLLYARTPRLAEAGRIWSMLESLVIGK